MKGPDGKYLKENKDVYALVFSTPVMLSFLKELHESGIQFAILVDGTYRLVENGWTVVSLSVHSVVVDPVSSKTHYKHKNLPLAFMVAYTECRASYEYLFDVVADLPTTHFGGQDRDAKLLISHVCQDRAGYIRSAARAVLGNDFISLTCNVHIKRKFGDKSNARLSHTANEEEVLKNICCMCTQQENVSHDGSLFYAVLA
ncbi:MAG: hypothetical protein ACREOZ_00795 [Gloeomargaritales cyanobacterium]